MGRILEGKYLIYKFALGVFTKTTNNCEYAKYRGSGNDHHKIV